MEDKITILKANTPSEEVTELILDDCLPPIRLKLLQPFVNLEYLSLKNASITTLSNFPKLPKLKKLDLSGNNLASALFLLCGCPQLTHLNLSNNRVKDILAVKQLSKLKNLQSLLLVNCEVTQVPYYRQKVFHYIKGLNDLDGENKTLADQGPIPEEIKPLGDTTMDVNKTLKKKRKSKGSEPVPKKQKFSISDKNSLMQLNEMKSGLKYVVESVSGPPHCPDFLVSVMVDGQRFTGNGTSKQLAKHAAAENVLSSLCCAPSAQVVSMDQDFTMDNDENISFESSAKNGKPACEPLAKKKVAESDKNPAMLLNELRSDLEYIFSPEDTLSPSRRFCVTMNVDGQSFEGYGQNKKQAKASVARAVLSAKYNINYSSPLVSSTDEIPNLCCFPQHVADNIGQVVMNTFKEVMVGNEENAKWKVIAGIVMTKDEDMSEVQVIGIGTGTKCINGEHISMVGATLNDCHAEIITRRCLKDFLYTNLELHLEGEQDQSILIKREKGGFCLKQNIKFHLYISTAPCGDARIFSPHEESMGEAVDKHPNRNSRGVLRTKIESGEGTIPVKSGQSIQTWDGILPGQERLLTMSCSDKIAQWNVTGLQGALLAHFVEPIYLESIILGGLFHPNHLSRALVTRFEKHLEALPGMYKLNKIKMSPISSRETRHLAKSPSFSLNWTLGQGRAEIINATTGKTVTGNVSRLSKKSFFQRFANIYERLSHVDKFVPPEPPFYCKYKMSVADYQAAKSAISKAFAAANLGNWLKKPLEQNEFDLIF